MWCNCCVPSNIANIQYSISRDEILAKYLGPKVSVYCEFILVDFQLLDYYFHTYYFCYMVEYAGLPVCIFFPMCVLRSEILLVVVTCLACFQTSDSPSYIPNLAKDSEKVYLFAQFEKHLRQLKLPQAGLKVSYTFLSCVKSQADRDILW